MINTYFLKFSSVIELVLLAAMGLTLPINGFPYGKGLLGEMSLESALYPTFVFLVYFWMKAWVEVGFNKKKMFLLFALPFRRESSFLILAIFVLWVLFSGLINVSNILPSYFKGRTGTNKFLLQFFILIYGSALSVTIYCYFLRLGKRASQFIHYFEKFLAFGFIIQLIIGTFEWIHKFTFTKLPWIEALQCVLVLRPICDGLSSRLTMMSGEPSWFAVYIALAMPVFWGWLVRRSLRFALPMWLWSQFILFFTYSRSLFIICIAQAIVTLGIVIIRIWRTGQSSERDVKGLILSGISVLVILSPLDHWVKLYQNIALNQLNQFERAPSISKSEQNRELTEEVIKSVVDLNSVWQRLRPNKFLNDGSNKTRMTMQLAGFALGLENPFWGVGWGQYGFRVEQVLTQYSLLRKVSQDNVEIASYFTSEGFWPHAHGILARVTAETGFIGAILWLLVWIFTCKKLMKQSISGRRELDSVLIATSSIFLVFFVTDSFRLQVMWLCLAWALSCTQGEDKDMLLRLYEA